MNQTFKINTAETIDAAATTYIARLKARIDANWTERRLSGWIREQHRLWSVMFGKNTGNAIGVEVARRMRAELNS